MLKVFEEEVQKSLSLFVNDCIKRNRVLFQNKALICEQFNKLPECSREIAFYKTLVNDIVCDSTISLDEKNAQPLH